MVVKKKNWTILLQEYWTCDRLHFLPRPEKYTTEIFGYNKKVKRLETDDKSQQVWLSRKLTIINVGNKFSALR